MGVESSILWLSADLYPGLMLAGRCLCGQMLAPCGSNAETTFVRPV